MITPRTPRVLFRSLTRLYGIWHRVNAIATIYRG